MLRFQGFPVREVEYSLRELESYKNRLDELGQELTRRLPSLVSWGVDPKSNSVRISLSQLGPDTERIIFEVAGWGPITLAHSAPAEAV
ncbi:MAG: S1 family peptidase [Acidobacteriota bacterium]